MSQSDFSHEAISDLGCNDFRLMAPVFVGKTINAVSEMIAKRNRQSARRRACHGTHDEIKPLAPCL